MKNQKPCGKVFNYELSYAGKPKLLQQNIFELNGPMNANLYKLRTCKDKKEFEKTLKNIIQYELWSRCEYEIYITDMFEDSEKYKFDVYDQVIMNGDIFLDYCWENRKNFKFFKEDGIRQQELNKGYEDMSKRSRG